MADVLEARFRRALLHLEDCRREVAPLLHMVTERDSSDTFAALEVQASLKELRDGITSLALHQFGVTTRGGR